MKDYNTSTLLDIPRNIKNSFNRIIVMEALERSGVLDNSLILSVDKLPYVQEREISVLIHDIFGGEILKTKNKGGWHFYNRIDGERIILNKSDQTILLRDDELEDIPSNPDEPSDYFEKEDYSTFFIKFIGAYEEVVGLNE